MRYAEEHMRVYTYSGVYVCDAIIGTRVARCVCVCITADTHILTAAAAACRWMTESVTILENSYVFSEVLVLRLQKGMVLVHILRFFFFFFLFPLVFSSGDGCQKSSLPEHDTVCPKYYCYT